MPGMVRPRAFVIVLLMLIGLAGCVNGSPAALQSQLAPAISSTLAMPSPSLAPSPSTSPSPTARPSKAPQGPKVAFFGDSQGMTLLLNRPADLSKSINATRSEEHTSEFQSLR